ncbi:ARMC3 protein, partial [Acromyrmex heyeri]
MTVVPDVINDLIESNYIGHFTKLLMREEDIFMQEYLSAVLAKLSEDPYGNALLANHCLNASILFERFQSPDPDIKKHNLEILHNLMHDPIAAHEISKSKKFNFSALYQHFESSYPEIQHLALDVAADLISRNRDEDIQSLFHETNGVKMLLDFLKNEEWNDLHVKALNILRFAAENPVVVDELIESGSIPQILYYIKHMENPKLFIEALRILVHVANTFKGRKILYSHEIIECLIDALRQPIQSDIVEVTCYIIGKMTLFDHAARELASTESIKTILGDINAWLESKFGRLQCDPHFSEYVELFKRMLLAKESKDVPATERNIDRNIQYVLSRAKMLAVFVARQMSGVDSAGIRYIDQQLEVHLKQIKKCLETNMIPLGQLRVGSYLERAMLFKAIADRICLPTAFVRGEYGVSWIEIAIPQMENSNEGGLFDARLDENNEDYEKRIMTELLGKSNVFTYQNEHEKEKISLSRNYQSTIYPTKLMKPNFIVDLMDTPGDLIPIGSPRSKVYTILY